MPRCDKKTGKMEETVQDREGAGVSDLDKAEVLQSGIDTLYFPAFAIATQLSQVLETPVAGVLSVGNDELRMVPSRTDLWRIGAVTATDNDTAQLGAGASTFGAWRPHMLKRAFRNPTFGGLRGCEMDSDRYAATADQHALHIFPVARFADWRVHSFARVNGASGNAFYRSCRDSSFPHTASRIPSSSHIISGHQQFEPSEYCSGKRCQLAHCRRTHKLPCSRDRLDAHGRPRPPRGRFGPRNSETSIFHCNSLNKASCFFCLMTEDQQTALLIP
jgi:hypothetical protein